MTADYSQWRRWLKGEDTRNYVRGVSCGFWRAKYGAADAYCPLATFVFNDEVVGLFLGEIYTEEQLTEMGLWPRAARTPITEEQYRRMAEKGESWSDAKKGREDDR